MGFDSRLLVFRDFFKVQKKSSFFFFFYGGDDARSVQFSNQLVKLRSFLEPKSPSTSTKCCQIMELG